MRWCRATSSCRRRRAGRRRTCSARRCRCAAPIPWLPGLEARPVGALRRVIALLQREVHDDPDGGGAEEAGTAARRPVAAVLRGGGARGVADPTLRSVW